MSYEDNAINDYVVRLTGKASIPEALLIGQNYELHLQGTVTSLTESDKNDGSHVFYYKFEPVVVELITDKGESIKAKDPRSMSQLFRARLWKQWQSNADGLTFDQWYERLMMNLIQHAPEVADMYFK